MSSPTPLTLGTAIDEALAPFEQDEIDLERRLQDTLQQIEDLRAEAGQIERDMGVIRVAKLEALRRAAADHSLLREAFLAADETPAEYPADGHPLLSPPE